MQPIHIAFTLGWNIDPYLHNSDHYPKYISISGTNLNKSLLVRKCKEAPANWEQFALDAELQTSYHNKINTFYKTIIDKIIAAAEPNIMKTQAKLPHPPVP